MPNTNAADFANIPPRPTELGEVCRPMPTPEQGDRLEILRALLVTGQKTQALKFTQTILEDFFKEQALTEVVRSFSRSCLEENLLEIVQIAQTIQYEYYQKSALRTIAITLGQQSRGLSWLVPSLPKIPLDEPDKAQVMQTVAIALA